VINDAPIVRQDGGPNRFWRPNNDNSRFYGPTRLRQGLTRSRNLVSIRLLDAMGIPYARDYIEKFGFARSQLPSGLSLALGSSSASPMQIASGFAVFANGGFKVTPYFIERISNEDGEFSFNDVSPDNASATLF